MSEEQVFRIDTPIEELSEPEKDAELAHWRNLWTWLPEEVKYYTNRVGAECRFTLRNFQGYAGLFLGAEFKPLAFRIQAFRREYDETLRKWYMEEKVMHVPASTMSFFEFMLDREEVLEEAPEDYPSAMGDGDSLIDESMEVG